MSRAFATREVSGFDPSFYQAFYADLRDERSIDNLRQHYLAHGISEGRWKSLTEAKTHLESRSGPLPSDFDAKTYRELNKDIAATFDQDWQCELHYLQHGRSEGRRFTSPTLAPAKLDDAADPAISHFDAEFYHAYYEDLRHLESVEDLRSHYVEHGMQEGRLRNPADARRDFTLRFGPLPEDFNTNIYKQLNPDIARTYDHPWQSELHFLEHGRNEGRIYRAGAGPRGDDEEPWMALFRLADFVACAQDWIDNTPQTREQAIAIFIEAGIDRLAPINLNCIFDPDFYRSAYELHRGMSDADLYRHWLQIGMPQGLSPSEDSALALLGFGRFPIAFDWQRYKSALSGGAAKTLRHRVDVLKHLCRSGFRFGLTDYVDGDGADDVFAAIGDYELTRGYRRTAIAAYDRALAYNPFHALARQHRGDAHAALGNTVAALADFESAIPLATDSLWPVVNAARMAAASQAFDKAFALLDRGRASWEGSAAYRDAGTEILDMYFAAKSRSAMSLYAAGDRHLADDYLTKALDTICDQLAHFVTFPPRLPPNPSGHIAILANEDLVQCTHYRVEQKQRQLAAADIDVKVINQNEPSRFIDCLLGARAAIFYRVPATPRIAAAIMTANALGIATYYEIDDLIFDAAHYPDSFESYAGRITKSEYNGLLYGVPLFRYAMTLCHYGLVSTTALATHVGPSVREHSSFVVRNGIDERNAKAIEEGRRARPHRDTVTIFYGSGTKAHNRDFNELAAPGLLVALETFEHVRLVIVGHLLLDPAFDRFAPRVSQLEFVTDLDEYWLLLSACDINIAVLSPSVMADCKSEIKWLEAAILQVPSIVSATQTYCEVLEDSVDALIVDGASAWTAALTQLIEDASLRRRIGAAARQKALQLYSLETAAAAYRKRFAAPVKTVENHVSPSRLKVLICAVFFPPQNHGGATRVVQDNVDYIVAQCPEIELSAFATDEGVSPPGQFRFDRYGDGVTFRLSVPAELNMDWRPFNRAHKEVFSRILDTVKPDLIHFHCIQRLTASIVEVALERHVPYIVTAHDGWWISDNQFLVDEQDTLRVPSACVFDAMPPRNVTLAQSVARRERLARLLEGAAQVVTVSESFQTIYRNAGCPNVAVIANGVSRLEPLDKRKRLDGRLALGHIGGRSVHKGAMLIEAVLRMNRFDHLSLTMIDFTMPAGTRSERTWGNTPVVLCGAYPQSRIAELYAQLDVLLAPSIWPESYGLVAREARSQGLWVVASNRGAMAEGITPDVNGFIVDVQDARDLTAVFRQLDDDVAHYQSSVPLPRIPMRSAADQGAEVAALYHQIVARRNGHTVAPALVNSRASTFDMTQEELA